MISGFDNPNFGGKLYSQLKIIIIIPDIKANNE